MEVRVDFPARAKQLQCIKDKHYPQKEKFPNFSGLDLVVSFLLLHCRLLGQNQEGREVPAMPSHLRKSGNPVHNTESSYAKANLQGTFGGKILSCSHSNHATSYVIQYNCKLLLPFLQSSEVHIEAGRLRWVHHGMAAHVSR